MSFENRTLELLEVEKTSSTKQKYKVNRRISLNSKRKEKYLIADTSYLTKHNITDIINYCLDNICSESFFILLTVLTGRNISKIKEVSITLANDKKSFFTFEYKLKKKDPPKELMPLYRKPITTIKLPLPYKIFEKFKNIIFTIPTYDKYINFIKEIKDEYSIPNIITINKISEYFSFWLINNDFDTSDVAIITGKLEDLSSGIHYYQPEAKKIHEIYLKYINHILGLLNKKEVKTKPLMQGVLGSKYVLKNEVVSDYFLLLRDKIRTLENKDFIERHNLFVMYTLNILNLSTGHRPVFDPYQLLKHFNLRKRIVYICDKRRDSALPYRFAILCDIAIQQFKNYIDYLNKIKDTHKYLIDGLSNTIENMLNSKIPIFLFIKNGAFINIQNNEIKNISNNILPIKLNWNRHFMKTELSSKKISGQLIDMFMGHDGGGDYGLSKYSSQSEQDLYRVSNEVNNILTELNIQSIKSK